MNKKYISVKTLLLVIITMLSISQLFGVTKDKDEYPYRQRQINLSGNFINFSIPENFSKDFPADDLVENVNINDGKIFEHKKMLLLLRRWWDFKDNSFIAKNVGSMMMTIHVNDIHDKTKNIGHPIDFIFNILFDMTARQKEENAGRLEKNIVYYPEDYQSFVERVYNNQRWLSSGSGTMDETTKTFLYWIPVSEKTYLTVEFNFAPNSNITMRSFIDNYCRDMMRKIMSTFDVIYSSENTIKEKLENNAHLKLEQLIEKLD